MFAKRLLQKVKSNLPPQNVQHGSVPANLDPHISLHYGIPSTSSILAFDPVQRLMAIGTLDGRIKVIGGDNVEGLLISPKQLPYKYLEFLHNQGFLLSVTNENVIQVWDLEHRLIACSLQWDSNITAFSVIRGTYFMYLGDEYGLVSVLKYDAEAAKLLQLPYHFPANSVAEAARVSVPLRQSVVGVLPQPCSSGNRVLIVYENGLIILWDVSEARVLLVKGYNDLQLKDAEVISSSSGVTNELTDDISEPEHEEKEISSVCWASSSGSILAVGYVDGDIMLWNMSSASSTKGQQAGVSSNDVVKLQLSSGSRRLPVIVLHWAANCSSNNDRGGQLFIYGGDDIGSEEVLTVLSLEWSSGRDALKCVNRVDLTLDGSFADMILIPNAGPTEKNPIDALFVLTNPGQLHVYDDASLSAFSSEQDKNPVRAMPFPLVIPTLEPYMTTAKLCSVPNGGTSSRVLMELASVRKNGSTATLAAGTKWPLTGGIPCKLSFSEDNGVERLYMTGYQDGSVRIWDATYPVLSLISVLEGEVKNVEVAGASAPVSALNFCSSTTTLAVGHESGLVCIYNLGGNSDEKSFHFVSEDSETKHEVHNIHQEKELQCRAAFSILNSPIRALQEATSGAKLAVGFECGKVAMLDMSSLSVLFLTDCVSGSSSPVVSIDIKAYTDIGSLINGSKHQGSKTPQEPVDEEIFILTKDSHIVVVNSITGSIISCWPMHQKKESTAISMFIIDSSSSVTEASLSEQTEQTEQLSKDTATKSESVHVNTLDAAETQEVELISSKTKMCGEKASDSLVLLCCEDALHVFSLKSVIQGDNSSIHKVNLAKPCCWTATFKEKDEKAWGLILLYQSGVIEIRSLPDLEIIGESSLMSILRWSFKSNMEKTISSSDSGQITLVNGCELAFISLFASESGFRTPESLPCLYDKVLAAAADAAISFSSTNKKKQVTSPGILGIIRGFKGEKMAQAVDDSTTHPLSDVTQLLESIFSRDPFAKRPEINLVDQEIVELNIDDIEIDEPVQVVPTSSKKGKNDRKGKESEREKLFQGASVDTKPRMRTPEEIMAKYRKAGDASAAAAQARDKLVQRQEKLERISRRTEELQDGAENFASMANELAKRMEARKWWNI